MSNEQLLKDNTIVDESKVVCSRCIYDTDVPSIKFDENGVCNYCQQIDDMVELYGTGHKKGEDEWLRIVAEIKSKGKGKKYDCVIGVSGGTDSSYMVFLAMRIGLRPLAVHYDDTWNSAIASENIRKVLDKAGVDLYTHVMDNKESDDMFHSFFDAGVAELGTPTDLALAEVLYRAASKFGVKYILEGHSFITEGISPIGKNYFDGKYIQSIQKKYGTMPIVTYPLMTFTRFMKWICFAKIKKIRPFWYLDYSKEDAREFLQKECDWEYYGGHHMENRLVAYSISVYLPQKFDLDYRNLTLSALARQGIISRESALAEYRERPAVDNELVTYFKKRLSLSDEEYEKVMNTAPHYWWEFPTYKKRFEKLRPLFKVLAKLNLVPMSFYLKYCFPVEIPKT